MTYPQSLETVWKLHHECNFPVLFGHSHCHAWTFLFSWESHGYHGNHFISIPRLISKSVSVRSPGCQTNRKVANKLLYLLAKTACKYSFQFARQQGGCFHQHPRALTLQFRLGSWGLTGLHWITSGSEAALYSLMRIQTCVDTTVAVRSQHLNSLVVYASHWQENT
jgi:hypothetical protein